MGEKWNKVVWLLRGCEEEHSEHADVGFPVTVKNCIHKPFSRIHALPQAASIKPALTLENASWLCWPTWPSWYLTVLFLLGNSRSQPIKTNNKNKPQNQPNKNTQQHPLPHWDLPQDTEFHQDHTWAPCYWANSGPLASVWHTESPTPDAPISLHKHPDTSNPHQPTSRNSEGPSADFPGI